MIDPVSLYRPGASPLSNGPPYPINASLLLHHRLSSTGVVAVQVELDEDDGILDHGAHRAEQPWDGVDQVLGVLRVCQQADSVGAVASKRKHEKEEREPWDRISKCASCLARNRRTFARLVSEVFDNLGNTSTAAC